MRIRTRWSRASPKSCSVRASRRTRQRSARSGVALAGDEPGKRVAEAMYMIVTSPRICGAALREPNGSTDQKTVSAGACPRAVLCTRSVALPAR